jgi:hypothetical protein
VGRGIAYAQRSGAVVAIVAEVEIDRGSGKIWARKFTVAHDCGLIINPDGLRRCIEGNVVQGTSRALSEEVTFDRAKVTRSTAPNCRPPAPAKVRSARSPRRWPTPSSTRRACASAAPAHAPAPQAGFGLDPRPSADHAAHKRLPRRRAGGRSALRSRQKSTRECDLLSVLV